MITREQVQDLREGDVVEYAGHPELRGAVIRGPLYVHPSGSLCVGDYTVRSLDGNPSNYVRDALTLTVVSRAPRPLYVNHPRTEPVPGDVVRVEFDTGCEDDWCMNAYAPDADGDMPPWLSIAREDAGCRYTADMVVPTPGSKGQMRLLVDGETGEVVP